MAFVIAVCCLFAILDMAALRFLIFLTTFKKALRPRIDSWIQDGVFQVQRRAFAALGEGTWEQVDDEIPVTSANTELYMGSEPDPPGIFISDKARLNSPFRLPPASP